MMRNSLSIALTALWLGCGCGDDEVAPTPDAGGDGGAHIDGGSERDADAGTIDGGVQLDAGTGLDAFVDMDGGVELDSGDGVDGGGTEDAAMGGCALDVDCLDTDVCNGAETCDVMHICVRGEPLVCVPSDACHAASCNLLTGCGSQLIDSDADGYASQSLGACGSDCDDADTARHPGAAETCDGIDSNCDGLADTDIAPVWYVDCDGDGLAASVSGSRAGCVAPPASATGCAMGGSWTGTRPIGPSTTDCDDSNASAHPGGTEIAGDAGNVDENCDGSIACFADADNDGYRLTTIVSSPDLDCNDSGEGYAADPGGDCNDTIASISPGAPEIAGDASNLDESCDGVIACFADTDMDGYRTGVAMSSADLDCSDAGEAYAAVPAGDCNDASAAISPGDPEIFGDAGDVDENCDGRAGCYADGDDDGYRTTATLLSLDADCSDPSEARASEPSGDCDDASAAIHPGALEIIGDAGNADENCDGAIACFADSDADGYRTTVGMSSADLDCSDPAEAYASLPSGDCNDMNAAISPGDPEIVGDPSDVDENCDGGPGCYANADADAFRSSTTMLVSADADCADPGEARASMPSGDCCDTDSRAYPGQTMFYATMRSGGCPTLAGQEYDFDCDGASTLYATAFFTGCEAPWAPFFCQGDGVGVVSTGWSVTVPPCGAADQWTRCRWRGTTSPCEEILSTMTQLCR